MAQTYTNVEDIPGIVSRLNETFLSGKTRDVAWRKEQLKHLAYMVQDNQQALYDAVKKDIGRSKNETYLVEISGLMNEIVGAVGLVEKWAKPEHPKVDFQFGILKPTIYKEPKGVALIIGTWNYHLSLTLGPLVGAIAAGCPAAIKVSEVASHSGALMAKLIKEYLDPSAFTVVMGEVDVITKLLEESYGHIFYTGNSKIARIISAAAAKTLTPVTLELGGKSPCIIDGDLKQIETAVKRIMWAKRINCGQTCIAPDYVIVPQEKQEALVAAFRKEHDKVFPHASLEQDDYPRIISETHYDRLQGMLDKTKGTVSLKGQTDRSTRMMGISVVKDVTWDDELMKSELFGPILPIVPVASISSAVERLKGETPLSLYIFSQSNEFVDYVRRSTTSGAVLVNDLMVQFTVDGLPFGGVGESGQGNYHGKSSFDVFTHQRSSLTVPYWADALLAVRYYPHTDAKVKQMQSFMIKKINFARPGTRSGPFGPGGVGWALLRYASLAALLAVLANNWKLLISILPRYKLVRVH